MHSRLCKQYITFHFNFTEIKPLKLQKLQCTINFLLLLQNQQAQPLTPTNKVNMNLCTNDVNRQFYQVPLMCHNAHNVGLMSTRVWPYAMTLSSQNGSPIQFSDSMFRTESMIQSLRDYQICHSVPRLRLTRRGLGSVNTCIKDLIWPS